MWSSIFIGGIAGIIVVFAVMFIDKIKIDDPVGAISVHLVCGIWGTLAVGLFGDMKGMAQFVNQVIGVIAFGIFCAGTSLAIFLTLKATMGLRVSEKEEREGLDLGEHGMVAYSDFMTKESH
jgi:Amt family ammonium transporter